MPKRPPIVHMRTLLYFTPTGGRYAVYCRAGSVFNVQTTDDWDRVTCANCRRSHVSADTRRTGTLPPATKP